MNQTIIDLQSKGLVGDQVEIQQLTSGTTDGRVYAVLENGNPSSILKYDHPNEYRNCIKFS